jgi:hypothetical protein
VPKVGGPWFEGEGVLWGSKGEEVESLSNFLARRGAIERIKSKRF